MKIDDLAASLDPRAKAEFTEIERTILTRQLVTCGLSELPEWNGREDRYASGDCLCPVCQQEYAKHPADWRVIGYGNVPFLNILCDGTRVKL